MKKELIHKRAIDVRCFETDGRRMIVEGELRDERLCPFLLYARNERREPGLLHHVSLSLLLSLPELEILSLASAMPAVPDPGCREIEPLLQALAGRIIRPGFSGEIRELFGKTRGCQHMTHLLLAIASAAVQGKWTIHGRIRGGVAPPPPGLEGSMLTDSCHMWRRGGPFEEGIRRRREARVATR